MLRVKESRGNGVRSYLIQLRVSADVCKSNSVFAVMEKSAIVAGDVDASQAGICFINGMIIERFGMFILIKKNESFVKALFDFCRQFLKSFCKVFVVDDSHQSFRR